MRKITQDSIRAFNNNYRFKRGNTEVRIIGDYEQTQLRLHGNLIAYKDNTGTYISTCGYSTVTTKERLNGLPNVSIHQRNYQWFLNGEAWNGEWILIQ